ncbi:LysR family transcriptional regulator [Fulvimarina sp. MAC8]
MVPKLEHHLKIRHFMLIAALDDHGTMHRAAEALNMTQSTASKMLGDLEILLGAKLFERAPRGMTPTALGRYALSIARAELTRIERFSEEFAARRDGGYGTLSIGAIMGAAPDLVAHAVADLKRSQPKLTVRLLGETSDHILDMLETGRLDLAVGRFTNPRHGQLFEFEPLAEEKLVLVARAGHPLTDGFDGDLKVLADWPWVLQPPTTPTRYLLDDAFAEAGIDIPDNVVECISIFAILNLVQASDAVAVLPVSVVDAHLRAGLLAPLAMRPQITVSGFGIVTRKNELIGETAELFADSLRRHARGHA